MGLTKEYGYTLFSLVYLKNCFIYVCVYSLAKKSLHKRKKFKCDIHSRIRTIKSLHTFLFLHTFYNCTCLQGIRHNNKTSLHSIKSVKKNLCILNENNKKITKKKCLYFSKMLCILGFLQMRWHVKGVNKILVIKSSFFMQQVSLYFNTKMPVRRVSKNIIHLVYFNYYRRKSAKKRKND